MMLEYTIAGLLGYAIAAVGYLALFLLLLTVSGRSLQRKLLLLAATTSFIWSLLLALQMRMQFALPPILMAESLKNISWLLLILTAFKREIRWRALITHRIYGWILLLPMVSLMAELYLTIVHTADYMSMVYASHLAQTITLLWLVEQLYRRTEEGQRWYIKPFCLSIGVVYIYDFILYADAMLIRTIELEFWLGRGWVAIIALPMLLLSIRRLKHWGSQIYVSRTVIFHSTLLLSAAAYLLLMSLAGYYIRFIGGSWGNLAQMLFFLLGSLLLVTLFLSDQLRSKLRVAISKHFFANRYGYREEWLKLADWLDDETHSVFDNALSALRSPFECKRALLALREAPGHFKVVSTYGASPDNQTSITILNTLAESSLEHDWIIDLHELAEKPHRYPFGFSVQQAKELSQAFRLIVPIQSNHGLKAVCLLTFYSEKKPLNYEDRDLMKVIGKQLSIYLHLHHTSQALSDSKQFDAFNRMSAFLLHDLKNVQAQLQLLLNNAAVHRDNPEFIDDAFDTVESASQRLGKVLNQLKNKQTTSQNKQAIDLQATLKDVQAIRNVMQPMPHISHCELLQVNTDKERLKSVLCHLVCNAQEATPDDGAVELSIKQTNQFAQICIQDTGSGMSDTFISERLFKPFDTTKGNAGMGIGAYDAKKFAEENGGYVEVESEKGAGTCFSLFIPLLPIQA